jgi:hypothetical protein
MKDFIECPVCQKMMAKNKLSAHIMNSNKEPSHYKFILDQVKRIKELYHLLPVEICRAEYIIDNDYGIYCSATYIRKIFRAFPDYKEKINKRFSINVKKQFKDGLRKPPKTFANGWKQNGRENAGKKVLSQERYDKLLELFHTDLKIIEISNQVGCKHETVARAWKENFTKEEIDARRTRTYCPKKPNKECEAEILKFFYSDQTNMDLVEKYNTLNSHIRNIFVKCYGEEEYEKRMVRTRKLGILKSLKITGKNGQTGSKAEVYCYNLLNERLDGVVHHDMDTLPPFEIDITIPSIKVAICWDGPFHRRPIFGENRLKKVQDRDKRKHDTLIKMGLMVIVIEDTTSRFNKGFVEAKVNLTVDAISKEEKGKLIC